ncbi:DUF6233 domain-containing protein [Streptomyces sp. NPDC013181]|uniref:DUF6233 domain-containing protein n=1 Tax=Streptomyces sp. NPDC013181 TaxID=3364864 RepID=UPI0036823144
MPDRYAYGSDVHRTSVHRADCWAAAEGRVLHSEEEAREAMRRPGARGCILCGTDMSLAS